MSFFIKDEHLLKKYNKIRNKVSNVINRGFDSKPVYNEKYLQTRIKSYGVKINTNFNGDIIFKKGSHCVYISNSNQFYLYSE